MAVAGTSRTRRRKADQRDHDLRDDGDACRSGIGRAGGFKDGPGLHFSRSPGYDNSQATAAVAQHGIGFSWSRSIWAQDVLLVIDFLEQAVDSLQVGGKAQLEP